MGFGFENGDDLGDRSPMPDDVRKQGVPKPELTLGRPLRRPGESKEDAARRLAREMMDALHGTPPTKPEEPGDQ